MVAEILIFIDPALLLAPFSDVSDEVRVILDVLYDLLNGIQWNCGCG